MTIYAKVRTQRDLDSKGHWYNHCVIELRNIAKGKEIITTTVEEFFPDMYAANQWIESHGYTRVSAWYKAEKMERTRINRAKGNYGDRAIPLFDLGRKDA
jgi:hypothetical protein